MAIAITRDVSRTIEDCELGFIERSPIDYVRAVEQLHAYRQALRRTGVTVIELPQEVAHPDACFVEDTAIVLDEIAIICNPGAPSRRGEVHSVKQELAKHRVPVEIESPGTIDGGDVLLVGKRMLVGRSSRTNRHGIRMLGGIATDLGYQVDPIEVSGCLHFKSACTAIDDETLLINDNWVDQADLKGFRLVHVPPDEAWGANVLRVHNTVFVMAGFPKTIELVRRVHDEVETLDVSEFRKAEASLTCLSILLSDSLDHRDVS